MYTHLGARFFQNDRLDDHFRMIMEYVASKDGWFVPVSDVLDFLRQGKTLNGCTLSDSKLFWLEMKWLLDKYGKKGGI